MCIYIKIYKCIYQWLNDSVDLCWDLIVQTFQGKEKTSVSLQILILAISCLSRTVRFNTLSSLLLLFGILIKYCV